MHARASSLEEFLRALLRGAAKILGCGSTNLILINEKSQQIRVRLGTMAVAYPIVSEIEQMMGTALNDISVPMRDASESLVIRAWRESAIQSVVVTDW